MAAAAAWAVGIVAPEEVCILDLPGILQLGCVSSSPCCEAQAAVC